MLLGATANAHGGNNEQYGLDIQTIVRSQTTHTLASQPFVVLAMECVSVFAVHRFGIDDLDGKKPTTTKSALQMY